MKKTLIFLTILTLMALLYLPNGASAEQANMIFKGEYKLVGVASDNVHDFYDETDDEVSNVQQRFRLTTIAGTENVTGVLALEIGWDEWGKSYSSQSGVGADSVQGGDTGIVADTQHTNTEVWLAYLDFKIPDTGLSIMAGKAPIATYQHTILTCAGPPPGIQATWAIEGGSTLKAFWVKLVEGKDPRVADWVGEGSSDSDFYYAEFSHKREASTFGVYLGHVIDNREIGTALFGSLYYPFGATKDWDVTTSWLGAYGEFLAGPVQLVLHGAFSTTDWEAVRGTSDDMDGSGYYARAMAFMKTKFGLLNGGLMYTNGDDDRTDNKIDLFQVIEGATRYPACGLFGPGPNLFLWGNGIAVEEYSQICLPPGGMDQLGRFYTNVGLTVPMGKKKLMSELWYLRTVEDPADVFGQTWRDQNIGFELDLELHYALFENLDVGVELDYLMPGDYFPTGVDDSADAAWLAAWGLTYTF
jgi:hypothetical protein